MQLRQHVTNALGVCMPRGLLPIGTSHRRWHADTALGAYKCMQTRIAIHTVHCDTLHRMHVVPPTSVHSAQHARAYSRPLYPCRHPRLCCRFRFCLPACPLPLLRSRSQNDCGIPNLLRRQVVVELGEVRPAAVELLRRWLIVSASSRQTSV